MSLVVVDEPANEAEEEGEEGRGDYDGLERKFVPASTSCYVCGRSKCKLLDQGPAVGMMCESCAEGFAIP